MKRTNRIVSVFLTLFLLLTAVAIFAAANEGSSGANAEKIIIGHTAIRPDIEYLESILETGCYICMDQCHCHPQNLNLIAKTLVELCKKGYTDKILLSNDYCIHSDFCNQNTNGFHLNQEQHNVGLGYIFEKQYSEYISMGGKEKDWNKMLCKNPIDILDN
jgi:phosphotriesterase-related protein